MTAWPRRLDAGGAPVAFSHRVTGSSILARWLPAAFTNGLDGDAVEGAAGPYSFPNVLVDYVRQEPPAGLTTTWWRGVGMTHNAFMVEGFIDELAAAAGKDPVAYRRALLDKAPRARAVLDLAAEKAGWGQPMPAGSGRGVSVIFGFGSYLAQVAEVAVGNDGRVRVTRVVCAVDCGSIVNPDTVKAQMEGGIIFGITAALYGDITIKARPRRAEQFRQLPDAADRRGAGDRGPSGRQHRGARRPGRARDLGDRARRRQRHLPGDRQTVAQIAGRPDGAQIGVTARRREHRLHSASW